MPSRYADVFSHLKPRQVEDVKWQGEVNDEKEKLRAENPVLSPEMLAALYELARAKKTQAEQNLRSVNRRVVALEQLLTSSQERGERGWGAYGVGENALRLENGGRIDVRPQISVKLLDAIANRRWSIENGYENDLRLLPQKLGQVTRERLVVGEPEPDGTEATQYKVVYYESAKD